MSIAMAAEMPRSRVLVTFLCFLAAIFEGIDIVSMGLAAPKLGPEFGLGPAQIGYVATASVFGLALGAVVGGRAADRVGRKAVLIVALVALAVFSLATAFVHDLTMLLIVRVLTGLGLGGAFPNLIAIVVESAPPSARGGALSTMYSGMPLGGILGGLMVFFGGAQLGWRAIFYLGGFGPLLLVPLLIVALPESSSFRQARAERGDAPMPVAEVLFGGGRAVSTLLLWVSFLFTLLVVYLLLNWVPSLMVGKGLTRPQGALVSAVLNSGGVLGSLILGHLMDRGHARAVVGGMYVGIAAGLIALAYGQGLHALLVAGFVAGFFAVGGQLVLYTLAPSRYATLVRGTGVGGAVAAGRIGAIAGPLMGGALLNAGLGAGVVILAAVPGLLLAGIAASVLVARPAEDSADPADR
jgi:AAHS family 3-hydroxyphenylpropionic acid transporter